MFIPLPTIKNALAAGFTFLLGCWSVLLYITARKARTIIQIHADASLLQGMAQQFAETKESPGYRVLDQVDNDGLADNDNCAFCGKEYPSNNEEEQEKWFLLSSGTGDAYFACSRVHMEDFIMKGGPDA